MKEIGILSASKLGTVPIFSADKIDLVRQQNWEVGNISVTDVYKLRYTGSEPFTFPFDFEILVGWGSIRTREDLKDKVKIFHAMASHRTDGNKIVIPPPSVFLFIAGYVSGYGVLRDIRTSLKRPWGRQDTEVGILPTSVQFSGTWVALPGYNPSTDGKKPGEILEITNNRDLASDVVRKQLYSYWK